jgi:ParB family chromosome partitioning protein
METTLTVQSLPVEKLQPNPWNRKIFDPQAMEDLAHSIKSCGIQEPLIVRQSGTDNFEIASGHRRWLAAKEAGLKEVPCLVQSLSDQQVAEDNITINMQREDIAPLELAQMLSDYGTKHGKSQREMADIFGKTEGWVSQYVGFAGLPLELKNFTAVKFSTNDLRALKQLQEDKQQQIVQELKDGQLKREKIQKRCRELSTGAKKAGKAPASQAVFHGGGQEFTFLQKGSHLAIVADISAVGANRDSFDAFMQNLRSAYNDYLSGQEKPPES